MSVEDLPEKWVVICIFFVFCWIASLLNFSYKILSEFFGCKIHALRVIDIYGRTQHFQPLIAILFNLGTICKWLVKYFSLTNMRVFCFFIVFMPIFRRLLRRNLAQIKYILPEAVQIDYVFARRWAYEVGSEDWVALWCC